MIFVSKGDNSYQGFNKRSCHCSYGNAAGIVAGTVQEHGMGWDGMGRAVDAPKH